MIESKRWANPRTAWSCGALIAAASGFGWLRAHQEATELREQNRVLTASLSGMRESQIVSPETAAPYTRPISADDLASGAVQVIGRLGLPLGTMMTVRGTWHDLDREAAEGRESRASKMTGMELRIDRVNGKRIDSPVAFHSALVEVTFPLPWNDGDESNKEPPRTPGETWEFRAYERGGFSKTPEEYDKELGDMMRTSPPWGRQFRVSLHGIMQRGAGETGLIDR